MKIEPEPSLLTSVVDDLQELIDIEEERIAFILHIS